MPDWELELLGATQEPAPATPHDIPASDAAPVPGEEQPEEAAVEAEEEADKELDLELQSDNLDPETPTTPIKGRPTADTTHREEIEKRTTQLMATISAAEVKKLRDATASG